MGRFRGRVAVLTVAAATLAAAIAATSAGAAPSELAPWAEPGKGAHHAKLREAKANKHTTGNANMTYHGGKIMPTASMKAIFWGTSWSDTSANTPTGDKITGLDSFYLGHSGSNYAKTVDEYSGSNGQVGAITTYDGHVVDASPAAGGDNTSAILGEVAKQVNAGTITLDTSGYGFYPVYTDTPRGNAGYCAWHSVGTINGVQVQFAFFFRLDGDPGCDPQDTSGLHSQGLAALANVSAHELSEARNDPALNAWYDAAGYENGDKCAWTFNVPLVTLSNQSQWKVQGEWSNAAYTAGTGYPNRSGQKGCLDGH